MAWLTNVVRVAAKIWSPQVTAVRYRYHADKVARGPLVRRYGFQDPVALRGLLPRESDQRIREMPIYRPHDAWSEKRALFGQNDYIDILGADVLHPTKLLYDVPAWLRGVGGKEYHVLLRKKKIFSNTPYAAKYPSKWRDLNKRIRWLYKFLNQKTKTHFTHKQ